MRSFSTFDHLLHKASLTYSINEQHPLLPTTSAPAVKQTLDRNKYASSLGGVGTRAPPHSTTVKPPAIAACQVGPLSRISLSIILASSKHNPFPADPTHFCPLSRHNNEPTTSSRGTFALLSAAACSSRVRSSYLVPLVGIPRCCKADFRSLGRCVSRAAAQSLSQAVSVTVP